MGSVFATIRGHHFLRIAVISGNHQYIVIFLTGFIYSSNCHIWNINATVTADKYFSHNVEKLRLPCLKCNKEINKLVEQQFTSCFNGFNSSFVNTSMADHIRWCEITHDKWVLLCVYLFHHLKTNFKKRFF